MDWEYDVSAHILSLSTCPILDTTVVFLIHVLGVCTKQRKDARGGAEHRLAEPVSSSPLPGWWNGLWDGIRKNYLTMRLVYSQLFHQSANYKRRSTIGTPTTCLVTYTCHSKYAQKCILTLCVILQRANNVVNHRPGCSLIYLRWHYCLRYKKFLSK